MHAHTQSFFRYTIAGLRGDSTVMELIQPLNDAPILFDSTGAIVRIEGAVIDASQRRDGPTAS